MFSHSGLNKTVPCHADVCVVLYAVERCIRRQFLKKLQGNDLRTVGKDISMCFFRKIIRIVTRIYFLAIIFALLLLSLFFYDFRRFKETTNGRSERIPENALNGLPKWDKNVLININNFQFIAIPRVCYREQPLHVLAFVVSAPRNFEIRQAIRTTWGRNHPAVETLFALGITNNSTLQKLINNEYLKYGDIVQGNFIDSYRNLTYKTSMCLKYAVYFCQNAKYYIKTDDDVYVNIEHILGFIKELEGAETRKNSIYCKTIADAKPERSHSKWSVTRDEYFHDVYPTYCQGWAVIFDFYTIYQLYQAVQIMRFFWVEDVHITGTGWRKYKGRSFRKLCCRYCKKRVEYSSNEHCQYLLTIRRRNRQLHQKRRQWERNNILCLRQITGKIPPNPPNRPESSQNKCNLFPREVKHSLNKTTIVTHVII